MYMVLTVPITVTLARIFSKTGLVFLEKMLSSVYSTVHILGLVEVEDALLEIG